jgi:hypothetical protein
MGGEGATNEGKAKKNRGKYDTMKTKEKRNRAPIYTGGWNHKKETFGVSMK